MSIIISQPWTTVALNSHYTPQANSTSTDLPRRHAPDSFLDLVNNGPTAWAKEWVLSTIKSERQDVIDDAVYFGASVSNVLLTMLHFQLMEMAIPLDLMGLLIYSGVCAVSSEEFDLDKPMPFKDSLDVLSSMVTSVQSIFTDTDNRSKHLAEFFGWDESNACAEDRWANFIAGFFTLGQMGSLMGVATHHVVKPHIKMPNMEGLRSGIEAPLRRIDDLFADHPPTDQPFSVGKGPVVGNNPRLLREGHTYLANGDGSLHVQYKIQNGFLVHVDGTPIPLDACYTLCRVDNNTYPFGKVTPGGRVHDYGITGDSLEAQAVTEAREYVSKPTSPHEATFDAKQTLKHSELIDLGKIIGEQIAWYEFHNTKPATENFFTDKINELKTKKEAVAAAHAKIKTEIDNSINDCLEKFNQGKNNPDFNFEQHSKDLENLKSKMDEQGLVPTSEFAKKLQSAQTLGNAAAHLKNLDLKNISTLSEITVQFVTDKNTWNLHNIEKAYTDNGLRLPSKILELKTALNQKRIKITEQVNGHHIQLIKNAENLDALKQCVDNCRELLGDDYSNLPTHDASLVQRLDTEITNTLKNIIEENITPNMTLEQFTQLEKDVAQSPFFTTHQKTIEEIFSNKRKELMPATLPPPAPPSLEPKVQLPTRQPPTTTPDPTAVGSEGAVVERRPEPPRKAAPTRDPQAITRAIQQLEQEISQITSSSQYTQAVENAQKTRETARQAGQDLTNVSKGGKIESGKAPNVKDDAYQSKYQTHLVAKQAAEKAAKVLQALEQQIAELNRKIEEARKKQGTAR